MREQKTFKINNGLRILNLTVHDIAQISGVSEEGIRFRIKSNINNNDLIKPSKKYYYSKVPKYDVGNHKKLTTKEIAKISGMSRNTINERIARGITGKMLLSNDMRHFAKHNLAKTYNVGHNKKMTAQEIADYTGFSRKTIENKASKGIIGAKLLELKKPIEIIIDGQSYSSSQIAKLYHIKQNVARYYIKISQSEAEFKYRIKKYKEKQK